MGGGGGRVRRAERRTGEHRERGEARFSKEARFLPWVMRAVWGWRREGRDDVHAHVGAGVREERGMGAHILSAADKGAVTLNEAKVLVNVDTAESDHGGQLPCERLPPRRKLLARLRPVVVKLDEPGIGGIFYQVTVRVRSDPRGGGEDGRCARPPASAAAAKGIEKVFLLPSGPLLLLMLLLDTRIVGTVEVVHASLLRVGECFIRIRNALKLVAAPVLLTLIRMPFYGGIAIRGLDLF